MSRPRAMQGAQEGNSSSAIFNFLLLGLHLFISFLLVEISYILLGLNIIFLFG